MTLLVRDEADIVDAHLAFHLNAGVDLVLATDHRSTDGTTEILESYVRDGHVRLIREGGERALQAEWVTRMARQAATEHGADWVLNSDADEFWWPRRGSLRDALAAVPVQCGVVHALQRTFVPRPEDGRSFAERMTVRLAAKAAINDPATPYRPVTKIAHRAHAGVVVGPGNHSVAGLPFALHRGGNPLEVLHLPLRSREQCARKYEKTWRAWDVNLRGDLAIAKAAWEQGRPESFYDRVVVDDEALARGMADGSLVLDTRLRDVLRALDAGPDGFAPPPNPAAAGLRFEWPSFAEDVAHAAEVMCFLEADLVRLQRRLDDVGRRLRDVQGRTGASAGPSGREAG